MAQIDISLEALDEIALASLSHSYKATNDSMRESNSDYDKKLLKALKRVIEYYGGSVDNE